MFNLLKKLINFEDYQEFKACLVGILQTLKNSGNPRVVYIIIFACTWVLLVEPVLRVVGEGVFWGKEGGRCPQRLDITDAGTMAKWKKKLRGGKQCRVPWKFHAHKKGRQRVIRGK